MIASNLLCEPLVPIYKDFKELKSEKFKGYKLVEKFNLNYYSIVSGLFRYKEGRIKHGSYTSLYERNPEFYNEELKDRVSVFRTAEDARNFLKEYVEICKRDSNLVVLEIEISGNLKSAKCSNKYATDFDCVIGDCMKSIKEI
jgi:hypothetical protein